jgi:16S rRNA (adenine1518-N6/adenine1519-N6)-dimethyltransferase
MNIKPLKRFGQNYLTDPNILIKIVKEIDPKPGDNIVEVGPGQGALTGIILDKVDSITAVEIDKRISEELKSKYPQLKLISGDFLELDLEKIFNIKKKKLRVVGNIPFNITSPILFKLIENNNLIEDSVLMVQYEVAKRIKGIKGTKDYGILSVLLSFFADIKFCFKVSPASFYPKPNVDSAVIHLLFKENRMITAMKSRLIQVIKASFGHRRKTLKNSLSNSIFKDIDFTNSGIDLSKRAEQLEKDDFLKLADFVQKKIEIKNNAC